MARAIHEKHKFLVEVPARLASAAFQKCSELSAEAAKIEYWEGGAIIPIKDGGRLTFSDVTLERGTSASTEMHTWFKEVGDAAIAVPGSTGFGSGLTLPQYKAHVGIVQLDRDNTRLREWALYSAWPTKYVAGEWDNTVDEVVIESLTLTYDRFDMVPAMV